MNKITRNITLAIGKIDRRHVQLAFLVVSLALLAIGAGAPAGAGSGNPGIGGG